MSIRSDLPIYQYSDEIIEALQNQPRLLLNAPTGSGKSTGLPPLLYSRQIVNGTIIIIQPRRLAAKLLAQRVSETLKVKLGQEVGYSVRFDSCYSHSTKILFLTDGVFLRHLQENPGLEGIDCILFDEFHERRVASDIALGVTIRLQETTRPELKLVVMSATLAHESLQQYLSPCKFISTEGRSYPVEIKYYPPKQKLNPRTKRPELPSLWDQIRSLSKRISTPLPEGNWLLFLPGVYEIRKTISALQSASWLKDLEIFPLYSNLPQERQLFAIHHPGPKIIVATNVAETSITIEGVRIVIDTGVAKESHYAPTRDLHSLRLHPISQASATQRAGRAGRTAPGTCYRLWSKRNQDQRPPHQLPEITCSELSAATLLLSHLGYSSCIPFPWLDTPPSEATEAATQLLLKLRAITSEGTPTPLGIQLSKLALPPRLASLVLTGASLDCLPEAIFAAAVLQGEPIVKRTSPSAQLPQKKSRRKVNPITEFETKTDTSSFHGLYRVYEFTLQNQFSPEAAQLYQLNRQALLELHHSIEQLQNQLRPMITNARLYAPPDFNSRAELFSEAIATTFPERLCRKSGQGTLIATLESNQKGRLEDSTIARTQDSFYVTEIQEIESSNTHLYFSGLVTASNL